MDDEVFEDEDGNFFDFTEAASQTLCQVKFQNMRMLQNIHLLPNGHLLIEGGFMEQIVEVY